MSISTQLTRLTESRDIIRQKLVELGLPNATSTSTLDTLATVVSDIVDRGAISVEILEGKTFTIPAGYHNGAGVVKAITDTTGEAEKYKTQAKTITPTKNQQSVTPDTGYYALESVIVSPIPDAYQNVSSVTATDEDVLAGQVFVTSDGKVVTGTMVNNGAVTGTLSGTVVKFTIPKGYHSGSGEVTITLEEKSTTPTKSKQEIIPTSGKVLSKVTVNPIPSNYADTSDANVDSGSLSEAVLTGTTVYAKDTSGNAKKINGTMVYHGAVTETVGHKKDFTIPRGFHSGNGKVSVKTNTCRVTPSDGSQTIIAEDGEVFTVVSVDEIPPIYGNTEHTTLDVSVTSDGTFNSRQLLVGAKVYAKWYNEAEDIWVARRVEGSMPRNTKVSKTLDTTYKSINISEGYHPSGGIVNIDLEEKHIDCPLDQTNLTEITPTSGKVLSKVTINPLPTSYADTSDSTITPEEANKILADEIVYGVNAYGKAVPITGTMVNQGKKTVTLDGLNTKSYTIPGGFHNGMGTVTFDDSKIAGELAKI